MKSEAYTTGAWIEPRPVVQPEGDVKWQWVVVKFDSDTFRKGEAIRVTEFPALNKEDLIQKDEDETNGTTSI